ncbi:hypothetical protein [Phaeodactylibacter xiamenensis]|uniref:hypothetical protein n=1 Tax=Phaeodactylibacter xiamenensis TaxID=1524460 RepID=UPI003CCC0D86
MKSLFAQSGEKPIVKPYEPRPKMPKPLLTTEQAFYIVIGIIFLMPVAGTFLYRRGHLLAGRILIGLFILLILINLLGTSEIGAKK